MTIHKYSDNKIKNLHWYRVTLIYLGFFATFTLIAAPCENPEHRAFDFWLGEWEVKTPAGKLVGTNRIEREYKGCVLHERYTTAGAYSGESLNIYDATRKVWHQTWVDTAGTLLLLEGGIRDGKMVLEGQTTTADMLLTQHRITWTPNADGSVRQFWKSTDARACGLPRLMGYIRANKDRHRTG